MAAPPTGFDEPPTGSWDRVDRAVKAFEDAWQVGRRLPIEDFLHDAGPERPALLLELIHVELERRLTRGEPARVEEYLRRFPEVRDDPAAELDLVAAEFRLRRQHEPGCAPEEFFRRFPKRRAELAARLAAEAGEPDPQPSKAGSGPRIPVSLLERLQHPEDADAWDRFAALYTPLLFTWARRAGLQETDAADLVQEVFAVLVRELPRFRYDASRSFRAWLRTVLLNKWRELNRRRALPTQEGVALDEIPGPAVPDPFDEEGTRELTRRALELLRPEFQSATWDAFRQTVLLGRPPREVAEELGLSANAVYIARSRVLQRLREELEGMNE